MGVLGVLDWIFLALSLIMSAAIGIYHGVKGLNQTSIDYYLGGQAMRPLPLAMSLTVGTVSAITIMGNAGEMYAHGTQLWMMDVGQALGMYWIAESFIPIFYPMKMISVYHYIEARFGSAVLRRCTVILTLAGAYIFIGFLLYPPSLFLKAFTGLPTIANVIIAGLVCAIYSSFGGVKAVVYTDVLQSLIMIIGSLSIVIQGSSLVGGFDKVWDIAYHHHRIEFFNLDVDPMQRHSFWLVMIYGFFFSVSIYGVNQTQTQRTFSTASVKNAKRVIYYAIVGMFLLKGLVNLSGLVVFANYVGCDPLTSGGGTPKAHLLIIIRYVLQYLTKIPGLAGLFVASIYAAVLSSVSTQVNSIAALLWEDFLKQIPYFEKYSDQSKTRFQKMMVIFNGLVGILTSLLASTMGDFLKDLLQITGAIWGPMVGLFLVALYFPWVKSRGAGFGFLAAITVSLTVVIGQIFTQGKSTYLPMSNKVCPVPRNDTSTFNTTDTQPMDETESTWSVIEPPDELPVVNRGVGFFGISYCLNHLWGVLTCILASLIYTSINGANTPSDVDQKLIHKKAWSLFSRGITTCTKEYITSLKPKKRYQTNNSRVEKGLDAKEEEQETLKMTSTT